MAWRPGPETDLVVVGGGAAGLSAARTARRRGASVTVVSDGPLGGDCTWSGCVPSKTLIESAAAGLAGAAALTRVRATVTAVAADEDAATLQAEGVDLVEGTARLLGPGRVGVGGRVLRCRGVVLATGSVPAVPAVVGLDTVGALTSDTVWGLTDRPSSLLVLGGGPIGVELAQAFARLGSEVTVVEVGGRLLSAEEPEASAVVARALAADGVTLRLGHRVTRVGRGGAGVVAHLDDASVVTADQLLVAAGRRPTPDRCGLVEAGVALDDDGWIGTDARMRTNVKGVYAAGDATGRAPYTHAADEMGRVAAVNALSRFGVHRFSTSSIPHVTFTSPEVARVGLTEAEAALRHRGARVAELPLDAVDRARVAGRTDGYIKLVTAPRRASGDLAGGRLVGATIVAPGAGEMIALPTLAVRTAMLPARLALTVQAYPTWSLGIRQAAAQLFVETGGRRARPARAADDRGRSGLRGPAPARR